MFLPYEETRTLCRQITYLLTFLLTYILTHLLTYLLTYLLLTPWSRVLLAKPTGFQPGKKFPTFYRLQQYIEVDITGLGRQSLDWIHET